MLGEEWREFDDRWQQVLDFSFDHTVFYTTLCFTYLSGNESSCEEEFVNEHHDRSSSWWAGGFVCALWLICELLMHHTESKIGKHRRRRNWCSRHIYR